eukprot:4091195-Prymnesium_polylepis.1
MALMGGRRLVITDWPPTTLKTSCAHLQPPGDRADGNLQALALRRPLTRSAMLHEPACAPS